MRKLNLKRQQFGDGQRLLHQENELDNAPIVPVPVEYADIDKAMIEFFDSAISLVDDKGEKVPIFKLLSNQRFSEYSQTWEHTDKDGNLFMNFKTINREVNPSWGTIHSGMANIPGDNRFTVLMREIIDDTGVECYEVTSMSQPLSVDLKYTISFVTSKIERLNDFNIKIIDLFKSKQSYVYPNGHAMPMTLDQIGDDSNYEIDGRKFYSQSVDITLMAYVIPKDDIKISVVPKRKPISTNLDNFSKTYVSMDYNDDDSVSLSIKFRPFVGKSVFTIDDHVKLRLTNMDNINSVKIRVNEDIDFATDEEFELNSGDKVQIKILRSAMSRQAQLIFKGTII